MARFMRSNSNLSYHRFYYRKNKPKKANWLCFCWLLFCIPFCAILVYTTKSFAQFMIFALFKAGRRKKAMKFRKRGLIYVKLLIRLFEWPILVILWESQVQQGKTAISGKFSTNLSTGFGDVFRPNLCRIAPMEQSY